MLVAWRARPTAFADYVYLADAWWHGRNWIAFPGDFLDAIPYHGRAYVIAPPLPALLLLPLVWLFGTNANQTLLDNALGALGVFAAWRLCERIGLDRRTTAAATAFAFFGTSFFVCATTGAVWFLEDAAAFSFSLLALAETFGRGRAWLVAVWALCAALSRYPEFGALPAYVALGLIRRGRGAGEERFAFPLVPALVGWVLYNFNRWRSVLDEGYRYYHRAMDPASAAPAFSLAYVPMQMHELLATGPRVIGRAPWIVPSLFGTSITFTSLPFAYAPFAGFGFEARALWFAVVATALPALCYYDSGNEQFGVRHALDFEPFLFALLLLALKRRPSLLVTRALVAFAAVGGVGALVWLLWPDLAR